jgi:hypothetical protein
MQIGKAPGGHLTHQADPADETSSLCGRVQGSLRPEPGSTRVGCTLCRRAAQPQASVGARG